MAEEYSIDLLEKYKTWIEYEELRLCEEKLNDQWPVAYAGP